MLTCIILCKGFSRGSRLMQRFLPGCRLMQSPQIPAPGRTGSSRLCHPAPTVSSVCRRSWPARIFHGDGLLRTHLLTAVTLDALAVIILRLAVSHFYGLAFYRAGTYADPAAHTFFPLHHRLLFQEWLQKTDWL